MWRIFNGYVTARPPEATSGHLSTNPFGKMRSMPGDVAMPARYHPMRSEGVRVCSFHISL